MRSSCTTKWLMVLLAAVLLAGCATPPPPKEKDPLVFYPEPPAPPRFQYLTSYSSSKDIEEGKSAFDVFVTGEKEKARRLDKPYGVAIYDGKIYVCDTNTTVMVFDLKKKTYGPMQGAQGLGKLVQPLNIFIDKSGNKYVADPVRGQVVVFDRNDFYSKAFGVSGEWKPVDAVVYEDHLYVADIRNREIVVLDKERGTVLKKFGQKGEPTETLGMPTNLAFDDKGYLYISDAGRFQVVKYDRDGHYMTAYGKLGSNPGFFSRPRGIALDKTGRLYAVDATFDNVQLFNNDGRFLVFFGKPGKKPGDLYLPAKVTIDYDNAHLFQPYAAPGFEIEYLALVTSQFGDRLVNIFAFGKEKGRKYPTDDELLRELDERKRRLEQQQAERTSGEDKEEEKKK